MSLVTRMTLGAALGLVFGVASSAASWRWKDLRDARLRRRGLPLPSDRVPSAYVGRVAACVLAGALIGAAL